MHLHRIVDGILRREASSTVLTSAASIPSGPSTPPAASTSSAVLTVPAQCYNECNNALIEAENIGKTPALCDPDSAFLEDQNACDSCLENSGTGSNSSFLDQFVSFCNGQASISSTTANLLLQSINSEEAIVSSLEAQITSLEIANTTSTLSAHSTITSSIAAPGSLSSLPTVSSIPSNTPHPQAKVWVAGPVIGVSAIFIAAGFGILLIRRRRKKRVLATEKGRYEGVPDKAQLHSDSIPPKDPSELDGSERAELAALEPAASELAS